MIHVGCWLWGNKYPQHYVQRLEDAVHRNLKQEHHFHVWYPELEDEALTHIPGCFVRLRTFSPEWQAAQGIKEGEYIVVLDLDLVVTGGLDEIFNRPEPFVIFQKANAKNPCLYNGSAWLLRAGAHQEVWSQFSLEAASSIGFYSFPEDQRWMEHMIPGAGAWNCGSESGIWALGKCGWPADNRLPAGAKIVAFPGARDPSQFTHLPWVKEHWR